MIAANMMRTGGATLRPGDTVLDALRLAGREPGGVVPVIAPDGRPVGVVSAPGMLGAAAESCRQGGKDGPGGPVEGVMETDFRTVTPETSLDAVVSALSSGTGGTGAAGRLFVVDDGGRFLGLITPEDVLKRIWEYREKQEKHKGR